MSRRRWSTNPEMGIGVWDNTEGSKSKTSAHPTSIARLRSTSQNIIRFRIHACVWTDYRIQLTTRLRWRLRNGLPGNPRLSSTSRNVIADIGGSRAARTRRWMSSQVLASATSHSLANSSSSSQLLLLLLLLPYLSAWIAQRFPAYLKRRATVEQEIWPAAVPGRFSIAPDRESRSPTETVVVHLTR